MKNLILLIAGLLLSGQIFAQAPSNDDCNNLIDLGTAPTCLPNIYTNVQATPSNIGVDNVPSCFNSTAARDVWFAFTCPDTLFDLRITLIGVGANTIVNPEMALYRGECLPDELFEISCVKAALNDTTIYIDELGLTPGAQYFIRISDYSQTATPNSGDFRLCVDKIPPISTIDQGGSSLCEGILLDTGGENGDYGPNEDFTFVICPSDPSGCISFTLDYYNIEAGFLSADELSFYDGNTVNAPLIASISNGGKPSAGGGVAFTVHATSGCMTVAFHSDANVQFEGWRGHWSCSSANCIQPDPISVNTQISSTDIANLLSTSASTVTVTNINCADKAYGTFNFASDNNDLGLKKGLVLTSGRASNVIGPNNSNGGFVYQNFTPGDPDLDYLSNDTLQESGDACIVEMDVFAATDELSFEYVFGSEEYPEYVNSINDIFAFFISGPGIVGDPGISNNAKNIALVPGTNQPVQIASVNNLLNWEYYRSNELGTTLQYDGLTSDKYGIKKSLTAKTAVIPCNTYHLKLAVADRADLIFDSGVFISEIKGGTPDIKVAFSGGIDYLIESCSGTNPLLITLSEPLEQATSYDVTIGGTAINGVDYTLTIPPTITFPAGETQLSFPITPITDNLAEGTETITITLSNSFGCGPVTYKTLVINLRDNVLVNITGGDTLLVCANTVFPLEATGATFYSWKPANAVSNPNSPTPTITTNQDIWLEVTGTVGSCSDKDSVYIKVINPTIDVIALGPTNFCLGDSVTLKANNNTNGQGLSWSPGGSTAQSITVKPSKSTLYTATIALGGCTVSDSIKINIDTLFFPEIYVDTVTVCQNYSTLLAQQLQGTTKYKWVPATGLNFDNISNPIATPDATTTYTLTATSAHGYCSQTASATIIVKPADIDLNVPVYKEICLGDTLNLNATVNPAGSTVLWMVKQGLNVLNTYTGPQVKAYPDETVTVVATYNINNCTVYDSVKIRVDSLPYSVISRDTNKMVYCPNEKVLLFTGPPFYDLASFPDITHDWGNKPNYLKPKESWNMLYLTSATDTVIRQTFNHGCYVADTTIIVVQQPPSLDFTLQPTQICPGGSAQITLTVNPPGTVIAWTPDPTLTCNTPDCLHLTANPTSTTTYTVKTPGLQCPNQANITLPVLPVPVINLAPSQAICFGSSIVLNLAPSQPGVDYTWIANPPGQAITGAQPSVTPEVTTTYTLVASGQNFCETSATTTINVLPQPVLVADATPKQICPGDSVQITTLVTPSTVNVQWDNAPGLSCYLCPNPKAKPTATTNYIIHTVGDPCPATDTVEIIVKPVPVLDLISDRTVCPGDSIKLNNAPGQATVAYVWTKTPGGFFSNDAQPTVTPTQPSTTYTVTAEGVGICKVEKSVNIERASAIVDAGLPKDVCAGKPFTLSATVVGTGGGIYKWLPVNISGQTVTLTSSQPRTYFVQYQYGPANSCSSIDSVAVGLSPEVVLSKITSLPVDSNICLGASVTLKVSVLPSNAVLSWEQDGITIAGLKADSVKITPNKEGRVVLSVKAVNAAGCTDSAGVVYLTKRCFEMANVFTPNVDEVNDTFGPLFFGGEATVVSFEIYNRWGQRVFKSTQDKIEWDGKTDNSDAPSDVYVYQIKVRFTDGTEESRSGQVTLLR
ncbi:MAG: choice-of-anchor L domain-containing protein [Bacteroidota bacterium]